MITSSLPIYEFIIKLFSNTVKKKWININ